MTTECKTCGIVEYSIYSRKNVQVPAAKHVAKRVLGAATIVSFFRILVNQNANVKDTYNILL